MSYPFDFAPKFSTSHETNCGRAKWLFCFWLRVGFEGWQPKANVPLWVGIKLFFKMCGGENKKYRSVGNECRLTRCPFVIWSVCCSPVKMVYFFLVYSRLFVVVVSSFTLAYNTQIYATLLNIQIFSKFIIFFHILLFINAL